LLARGMLGYQVGKLPVRQRPQPDADGVLLHLRAQTLRLTRSLARLRAHPRQRVGVLQPGLTVDTLGAFPFRPQVRAKAQPEGPLGQTDLPEHLRDVQSRRGVTHQATVAIGSGAVWLNSLTMNVCAVFNAGGCIRGRPHRTGYTSTGSPAW